MCPGSIREMTASRCSADPDDLRLDRCRRSPQAPEQVLPRALIQRFPGDPRGSQDLHRRLSLVVAFSPTLRREAGLDCRGKPFFGLGKTRFTGVRTFFRGSQIIVSKKKNTRGLLKTRCITSAPVSRGDSHLVSRIQSVVSVQLVHVSRGRETSSRLPSSGRERAAVLVFQAKGPCHAGGFVPCAWPKELERGERRH
jgi:hypothetical protein